MVLISKTQAVDGCLTAAMLHSPAQTGQLTCICSELKPKPAGRGGGCLGGGAAGAACPAGGSSALITGAAPYVKA